MHRLVPPLALLLAGATLAQAEMITRTHADGSTSVVVPALAAGPPAPLAWGVAWPWFPYYTELWRLREAAQQAQQQEQAAAVERLTTPPLSPLRRVVQRDGTVTFQVVQTTPSLAVSASAAATLRDIESERAAKEYAESLGRVSQDPACAHCRTEALMLGRLKALKQRGTVSLYDEAAIANDLNAVSAGAPR